jgi:hypothetical protein
MTTAPLPPDRDASIEAAADPPAEGSPPRPNERATARADLWPSDTTRLRLRVGSAAAALATWILLALILANARLGWLGRPDEADRARGVAGALIAIGLLLTLLFLVMGGRDPLAGVRRLLLMVGVILMGTWLPAVLLGLPLRPKGMLEAYAVVGVLMVIAAIVLSSRTPLIWAFGMAITSAFWVCGATIALGLLFAEGAELTRVIYLVSSVLVALSATWALAALFGEGSRFGVSFDGSLSKLSGFTIAAVLGLAMTSYGLWYSLVIDPTDQPASINVSVTAEPVSGEDERGRFGIVIRAENPTDAPVTILHSPYEIQVGYRSDASDTLEARPVASVASVASLGSAGAAEDPGQATDQAAAESPAPTAVLSADPSDGGRSEAYASGSGVDPRRSNVENSCVLNYRDNHPGTSLSQGEIIRACSIAAFEQTLPPGLLSERPSADVQPFAQTCQDWRDREPVPDRELWERHEAYAALYPRYCEIETGLAWPDPVHIPPRSFVETHIIVPTPSRTDVIQVFTSFAFGYEGRLQEVSAGQVAPLTAAPTTPAFTGACPANPKLFRLVAFDPITGLIGAWDPVTVVVARGSLAGSAEARDVQTSTRSRSVICVERNGVTTSGTALARVADLVGVHETLDQFFHDPS